MSEGNGVGSVGEKGKGLGSTDQIGGHKIAMWMQSAA